MKPPDHSPRPLGGEGDPALRDRVRGSPENFPTDAALPDAPPVIALSASKGAQAKRPTSARLSSRDHTQAALAGVILSPTASAF
jgi:hypothetical protein